MIVKKSDGKGNNKDTNSNNTHNNKDYNGNHDDNDDYDDDDDDELEILDGMGCADSKTFQHVHDSSTSTGRKNKSESPNLLLTFLDSRRVPKKQGALANPRTVLRNKLRVKQFQAGNGWLAR